MHTQGEHANSTQKGPSWESNLEPYCCEATVLTTTPPCSLRHRTMDENEKKLNVVKWPAMNPNLNHVENLSNLTKCFFFYSTIQNKSLFHCSIPQDI